MPSQFRDELQGWVEQERLAIAAIASIYKVFVERSVELLLFRRLLIHQNSAEILQHHLYARQISKKTFGVETTYPIIEALAELPLCPSRIDVGRLAVEWLDSGLPATELKAFLAQQLDEHIQTKASFEPRDVVLYGFGRIGRIMARILINQSGGGSALRLRAVVCRGALDLEKRAKLLRRDSIHGPFDGIIEVLESQNAIMANGVLIQFISSDAPDKIDYEAYGLKNALIIDNTGVWRDREALSKHLSSKGAERVLLTAPAKGNIPNIVYGINHKSYGPEERIFSAASCTTNAIVPPLRVLNDSFGIDYCHIETVHSYTNDQNLLDNYHKKERRGRSAPLNMVITETGAASAISKALPELTGRVTGNSVRVPTANVSLAILNLTFKKEVSRDEINDTLRQASLGGKLAAQIDYTNDDEVVSTDMVGNSHASIVDSLATIVHGNHAVVYCWYDNEWGYSMQVARLARIVSGVERLRYY